MLRNRYGLNAQVFNWSRVMYMTPVGYHEVAPGETIAGKVSVNAWSQPTVANMLNRMYIDGYAFYVPFRVLDPNWPDIIAQNPGAPAIPTVSDTFQRNLEVFRDATPNNAYQRYAYNTVWNRFFRASEQGEAPIDSSNDRETALRPGSLDKAQLLDTTRLQAPALGTTTQSAREAFAKERFDRTRAIYGGKYVDYLRSLGVEANWSLLDEPEAIGQVHGNWRFRMVTNVVSGEITDPEHIDPLGTNGGYFNGTLSIPVKKTFCPEHGLIMVLIVVRGEQLYAEPPNYVHLSKITPEDFWTPEFDQAVATQYTAQTFPQTDGLKTDFARWEEYRKAMSTNNAGMPTQPYAGTYPVKADAKDWSRPKSVDYDNMFNLGTGNDNFHFQATANHRLTKLSPIKKVRAGGLIG